MRQLLLPEVEGGDAQSWTVELLGPAGEAPTIDDVAEALAAALEDELGFAVRIEKTTESAPMSASMADQPITSSHPTAPFTCLPGTGIIERGPGSNTVNAEKTTVPLPSPFCVIE